MKKKIQFFVSYAHSNKELANNFLGKLIEMLAPSKRFKYVLWKDTVLVVGEEWEKQILQARDSCDLGLLLVSPAFLASKFISEKELPVFVSGNKASIPVMLQPVDFLRHDLKGLEKRQIFRLNHAVLENQEHMANVKNKEEMILFLHYSKQSKIS